VATGRYQVYNFGLFRLLKQFYDLFPALEHKDVQADIPPEIMDFIGRQSFSDSLTECRKYASSSPAFLKRMYDRFDAFFIVKFLNTFDGDSAYPPVDVMEVACMLGCDKSF
jgi:hypothetical protein